MSYIAKFARYFHLDPRQVDGWMIAEFDNLAANVDAVIEEEERQARRGKT